MRRELAALALLAVCSDRPATAPRPTELSVRRLTLAQATRELHPDNRGVSYRPATVEEKAAVTDIVRAMWGGDPRAILGAADDASAVGLLLERWEVEGRAYVVLREPPSSRRGAGLYLVRASARPPVAALLQAPHAYFDLGTGEIATRLVLEDGEPRLRGLFLNSLHRYQVVAGERRRDPASPSDVCHNPDHLFATATAAAIALPGAVAAVVQLHGFEGRDEDEEPAAAAAQAIVSTGQARSSAASTALAAALGGAGAGVLRYPEETRHLGATRNVQGRLSRAAGVPFLHLELSRARRDELVARRDARDRLRAALMAGVAAGEAAAR